MFLPWTRVAAFVALAAFVVIPKKNLQCKADPITESAENWDFQLVKSRLEALQLPIPVQTNEQVISRIRQYVTTGKTETEAVLGRSELYFPIFEHQLKAYGLPEESYAHDQVAGRSARPVAVHADLRDALRTEHERRGR
jgi:membrane-bound lytic murein transglycosylase D